MPRDPRILARSENYRAQSGMPEFKQGDATSFDSIVVHFRNAEDRRAFLKLVGEDPARRKSVWYPHMDYLKQSAQPTAPVCVPAGRYPIYIPTKGRWESRLTIKSLEKLGLDYRIVIEPHEAEQYGAHVPAEKILLLPWSKPGSSGELVAARNWIKDHATAAGAKRHWQLDDNIDGFYRLNQNLKTKVIAENPFAALEDFVDRYENVAIAGLQYEFFADRRSEQPPFRLNTRVYSCSLILNALSYGWRAVYNDDTDICLRVLKDGWCTVLFNAFLCLKSRTMTVKGGNTPIYQEDGRLKMAQSLVEQHPDVTTISWKWGRWQHRVDYRPFEKNKLRPVAGAEIPEETDDRGMVLVRRKPGAEPIELPDETDREIPADMEPDRPRSDEAGEEGAADDDSEW